MSKAMRLSFLLAAMWLCWYGFTISPLGLPFWFYAVLALGRMASMCLVLDILWSYMETTRG